MRKILFPLIFSLLMMAGSGMAMADNHRGSRGGHNTEQRDHRNHNNGKKNDKKKHDKKYDYRPSHGSVAPAHRPAPHYRPAPPKPHHKHHAGRALPPRLHDMVAYTTRGCSNVAVWQIDPNTFIVKFRKGGRYYTRMLYPYSCQYGPTQSISVNWQPLSPWTLIPSVNLNISL